MTLPFKVDYTDIVSVERELCEIASDVAFEQSKDSSLRIGYPEIESRYSS